MNTDAPSSVERQRGFVALAVIAGLVVIAAIAMLLVTESTMESDRASRGIESLQAEYAALAAIEHAEWHADQGSCENYALPTTPFGAHSYSASFGSSSGSPIDVSASATLATGISRSLSRTAVRAYQPSVAPTVLQPDPAGGTDGYVYEWKSTWNYGTSPSIWVDYRYNDSQAHGLIKFNLGLIPYDARVSSAVLELYQGNPSLDGGAISVHRTTRSWAEGEENGRTGAGASWNVADDVGTAWSMAGGDYELMPYATTTVPADIGWSTWDITSLVAGWVAGEFPNDGLLLRPEASGFSSTAAHFASSDNSTASNRPKLTIEYSCECGITCAAPQGAGNLLFVVGAGSNPSPRDAAQRALFESWGYTVNYIDDGAIQSAFDSSLSNHDVAYVSSSVDDGTLGDKLANAPIGVVSEYGLQSDNLGISTSIAWTTGNTLTIAENSHYITQPFELGDLRIYDAAMEGVTAAGTTAPDIVSLGQWSGAAGLPTLEAGAQMAGGGTVSSRRVMLPFGRNIEPSYLNNNGRLIMQRALEWGTAAGGGGGGDLLMVVVDPNNLTAQESAKTALMESWGFTVTLIDMDDSQSAFDNATAANGVVYLSDEVTATALGSKLTATTTGIVSAAISLRTELGFAGSNANGYRDTIDIIDNSHSITTGFALGLTPITSSLQQLTYFFTDTAPGQHVLAETNHLGPEYNTSFVTLETGAELWGGGIAAGRRVQLPWGTGSFDIHALNAEGQTLLQRAIEWAAGIGAAASTGPIAHWKLDETSGTMAADSEGGHNGKLSMAENWGAGRIDGGLEFDGIDDAIVVAHEDTLSLTQAMTFAAWVRSDAFGVSGPYDLVVSKGTVATSYAYYFGALNDEIIFGFSADGLYREFITPDLNLATGTWHHIAATFDNSSDEVRLYHDGVEVLSATTTYEPSATTHNIYIGSSEDGADWDGVLDDVRIYDRVVSASEISDLYAEGAARPIAHWMLDDGAGTTALDSAGGHHGTLSTNGPTWVTGYIGDGLAFDGTDDYVGVPYDNSLSFTEQMTFAAWAGTQSTTIGYRAIVAQDDPGNGMSNYWFGIWNDELVFGFWASGAFREVRSSGLGLTAGTWHHLAASFDNTTDAVRLYSDGSEVAVGAIAWEPTVETADLWIGRSIDGEEWRGRLDDIRIYDRVLDTSEIAAIASFGSGEGPSGPSNLRDGGVTFAGYADASLSNNGRSLDIGLPADTASGDLLIAAVATDGNEGSSLNPPAGWNSISVGDDTSGRVALGVWWKIASSSEPSQYTFDWSASEEAYGWIMRFTGHDPSAPIVPGDGANGVLTGSSQDPSTQHITTTEDNVLVLRVGGFDDDDVTIGNPGLAGHRPITMGESGTGAGTVSGGAGYMIQTTAGDSGLASFSLTSAEEFRTVTLGIKPAPAP